MLIQILSLSSILLGIYLLFTFMRSGDQRKPTTEYSEFHMGCFSPDNQLSHSQDIKKYIEEIEKNSESNIQAGQRFELVHRINYNQVSRSVAYDFQKYLSQYYQIKSKNVFEKNYYRHLNQADEKFKTCQDKIQSFFNKDACKRDWKNYEQSHNKYERLKDILKQKIERKEEQQKTISYLILDLNSSQFNQFEKNINTQLYVLTRKRAETSDRKISLLSQKSSLEISIANNKTKLDVDQKLLNECGQNIKLINFCNEVTKQVNTIKLTFSKQDIQKKIQNKKHIIDSFKNAIKNAEKLGNKEMIAANRENLQKNQKELQLLISSASSFQTFQESYCSKCTPQRIKQLTAQIESRLLLISKLEKQLNQLIAKSRQYEAQIISISNQIQKLENQKESYFKNNTCTSPECEKQRQDDIKEKRKVLNEMKKQVLDYKSIIAQHFIQHSEKNAILNDWAEQLNSLVDCLNQKQLYQALKQQKPQQSKQIGTKIDNLQTKLVERLEALGP